jgi:hypothetical protein
LTIAELLSELSTNQERIWAIIQYWSSVSFGLIIAMHMIQTQLKWAIVSALLLTYAVYSLFCAFFVQQASTLAGAASRQAGELLADLQTQGKDLTIMREGLTASFSGAFWALNASGVAMIGLFLITIAYTIHRQLVVREEAS